MHGFESSGQCHDPLRPVFSAMVRIFDPSLTMKQQLQRALIGAVFLIVAIFLIVLLGSGLGTIDTSRSTIVRRLNHQQNAVNGSDPGCGAYCK